MDSIDPDQNGHDYKQNISDSYQEYVSLLSGYDKEQKNIIGIAYKNINQKLIDKMRAQIEATLRSLESSAPGTTDAADISFGSGSGITGDPSLFPSVRIREVLDNIARNNSHFMRIAEKYRELFPQEELGETIDWHKAVDDYRESISRSFDKIGEILRSLNEAGVEDEGELLELYRYLEEQRSAVDHVIEEGTMHTLPKAEDTTVRETPASQEPEIIKPSLYDSVDSSIAEEKKSIPYQSEIRPPSLESPIALEPQPAPQSHAQESLVDEKVFDYSDGENYTPDESELPPGPNTIIEAAIEPPLITPETSEQPSEDDEEAEEKQEPEPKEEPKEEEHHSRGRHKAAKDEDDKKTKEDKEDKNESKGLKQQIENIDKDIKVNEDSINELKQMDSDTSGTNDPMDAEGKALLNAEVARLETKIEELKSQKVELEKDLE